jgi:hypothetical protein
MYWYSAGARVCNATQHKNVREKKGASGASPICRVRSVTLEECVCVSKALALKSRPTRPGQVNAPIGVQEVTRRAMRSAAITFALLLLAGCETPVTRKSSIEETTPSTHLLREEPHRAAVCIARNIDRHRSALLAQIRPGAAPVLIEVQVRADDVVALAHLLISGEGSTAVIWLTPDPRYRNDALVQVMIAGC